MAFSILSGNSGKTCFPSFFALALSAGGYPKQKRQEKNDDDYIHSSFNSRIAAKHPVKHFVIIKRGGVVTGPQTVPKVYVGHVFLVPINYISLGMVRATGYLVQLRYVANNSVLVICVSLIHSRHVYAAKSPRATFIKTMQILFFFIILVFSVVCVWQSLQM